MTTLQGAAQQLISPTLSAADGMQRPAGVTVGILAPGVSSHASAGHRTVHWQEGERHGIEPMTVETHHDMASVTKVLGTTACLLRLVSDRLVDLDANVCRYLPGFRGAGRDSITVRDLLLHRGGLKEWYPLYAAAASPDDAYRLVETLPLVCAPKTARRYSDLGFILLGRIVSTAAGQNLAAATAELVTKPLGLESTQYAQPAGTQVSMGARDDRIEAAMLDSQIPYPVPFTSSDFSGWRRQPVQGQVADGNSHHVFDGVAGHAGLFSTVPDLLGFAAALATYREHDSLWRSEVVEEFCSPGPDAGQAHGFRRYKLRVNNETLTVLGHPGYVGCAVGFVPERSIALALTSNRLLVDGDPVPTERLWGDFLGIAGDEIGRSNP